MTNKLFLGIVLIFVFAVVSGSTAAAEAPGNAPQERISEPSMVAAAATQEIQLHTGWNLVSSYVDPANPDMDVVFSAIIADVVLVKDGLGQVYWPAYGVDQIGGWDVQDGYQIYMQNATVMSIGGTLVDPAAAPMALDAGWSMIAYSRDLTQLASEALSTIDGQLLLAKDGDGQVYWPAMGIDQVGYMQPGKGYQVYLTAAGTLLYPDGPATALPSLVLSGAISVPGEVDSFIFTAQAGDAIIIGATKTSGPLWLELELYDSAANKLSGAVGGNHAEIIYNVTSTAEYTITISHDSGEAALDYKLFLQRFNDPVGAVAIGFSDNLAASIVEPAEMDAYTFNAVAGDAIIIGGTKTSGPLWLEVELYDAAGVKLASAVGGNHAQIIYNVTVTAEYTILVSHDSGEAALDYNLFLQRFNDPVGAVAIGVVGSYAGTIDEPAEMDAFTFNAQAGDMITIGATKTSGPLWLEVELYDSTGNKLTGGVASSTMVITYDATETAEYTILISHDSGESAIGYELGLSLD